ncbi:unnamed protein product, partial [marine sediment metagenome]
VSGNNAHHNGDSGIELWESLNNEVSGNNARNNPDGIQIMNSDNNTISGNNVTNNGGSGISLAYSDNNEVSGNNASNNYHGIKLQNSNNNTVSGNNATNNEIYGIYLRLSDNNTISGNNATNNRGGIKLEDSNNNNISENTLFFNVWSVFEEVSLKTCEGNVIENNDRCTRIESAGIYDFGIIPYGRYDFDVDISIVINADTKLLLESLDINPSNTTLSDGLLFVEIALNESSNLNGKINITIEYTGTNKVENLNG